MKNTIIKTTLTISLAVATLTSATHLYAKNFVEELGLTDTQIEQLQAFKEAKKLEREAQKEAQLAKDRATLESFLSPEQVDAIMEKMSRSKQQKGMGKGQNKGKGKVKNRQNLLELADQLDLTENQKAQISAIYENAKADFEASKDSDNKPSKEERKANKQAIKEQVMAVLTDEQIEKLKSLRKSKK